MCRPKGMIFGPFWSENRYGFQGNYGNVWTYLSFQFQINKKELAMCKFEMHIQEFFLFAL